MWEKWIRIRTSQTYSWSWWFQSIDLQCNLSIKRKFNNYCYCKSPLFYLRRIDDKSPVECSSHVFQQFNIVAFITISSALSSIHRKVALFYCREFKFELNRLKELLGKNKGLHTRSCLWFRKGLWEFYLCYFLHRFHTLPDHFYHRKRYNGFLQNLFCKLESNIHKKK